MNGETVPAAAQQLTPIDSAAHNAIFTLVQLYGRLLAEKEMELTKLQQRYNLAALEVTRLRGELALQLSRSRRGGQTRAR